MAHKKPFVFLILDGWGYREETSHNAIAAAKTPQWDEWWQHYPHILLEASGKNVGLPACQMGNSEVGHMHIGSGRLIWQDLTRINESIENGEFFTNSVLIQTIQDMKKKKGAIHIFGLLSPGGVHSHEDHFFAFLKLCRQQNFHSVQVHAFLDGRDTPPQSAEESLCRLENLLQNNELGRISSISGRYYAMDRDKRWERTQAVYDLLTEDGSKTSRFSTALEALQSFYSQGTYDEFIPPTQIGQPRPIVDGDSVVFLNFRSDRARQLTQAFVTDDFTYFQRFKRPQLAHFVTLTQYADFLKTEVVFPPQNFTNTLGEILSREELTQLRIAETEKYAHVTFFFNGGFEKPFRNEERILIPSPPVATYDLKPEMSALEIKDAILKAIKQNKYDIIICNFANADMVGHTGNFTAAVKAIECLDGVMHDIGQAVEQANGQLLITSDHGNAEAMYDSGTKQPHTAHTNSPVPLLYIGQGWKFKKASGSLKDIAPTILSLLGITQPQEMTGHSLMEKST